MNVTLKCSLFALVSFFLSFALQCTNIGYPFENHLGTKTPYRIVSNKSFEKVEFEGCTPRKIWMMVRHGTRNPKISLIEKIKIRLPEIKRLIVENVELPNDFIRNRDLDLFRKWKNGLDHDDKKKLTHEGEEEMLLLAERMQNRFPQLFDNVYSNTSYKFKYTYSQRTQKSAYYFTTGLFGRATAKDVWYPEPSRKDPILRFYKLCDKWNTEVKKNPSAMQEKLIFLNGPEMADTVRDVNDRLGLREELLTLDDIVLMYEMCGFETAWNKKSKSPWCSPFTVDNLKVLEYAEDLKFYWQDGYGYELTYKQACPAFADMMTFMQSRIRFPRVTVYFSHSGTILKMLAHLGLYKDEEVLTAKNYEHMSGRKWRTSLIDSFGSNIAFVLYGCGSENKLLTLHQENIIRLPACPDTDLCDINKIEEFYLQSFESCDFNSICNNNIRR
nr:multiple inositol polyphosphate phosphatase 1 [Leptinotarsa decemlineata]